MKKRRFLQLLLSQQSSEFLFTLSPRPLLQKRNNENRNNQGNYANTNIKNNFIFIMRLILRLSFFDMKSYMRFVPWQTHYQ